LQGLKIAVDASILLENSKNHANPQKFIQEGGASLDMQLQKHLVHILTTLKKNWNIDVVVVMDGIFPKLIADN